MLRLADGRALAEIQKTLNFHKEVHTGQNSMVGTSHAWCAAFVNWCLMQAGYEVGGAALAGSVEGPFIVWMNLGTVQPQHADVQITAFVNGPQRLCWPDGALLYMRQRPPGVTPALVRRALVGRNAAAQTALRALLRKPFGEVPGFDGVVAYADHGTPRLLGLPMKGAVRAEAIPSASGEDAWGATFCHVLPPISRRP